MYCHACGNALTQPTTKYCNRCGANLVSVAPVRKEKTASEKRLDDHLDGLFWITVVGLGFIVGGSVLMNRVTFRVFVLLVYAAAISTLFLINFVLNLWGTLRLMRITREERNLALTPAPETAELNPAMPEMFLTPANGVT